jgi:predicted small secreted protein
MKKLLMIVIVLILTLPLAACGAKEAVQGAVKDAISGEGDSSAANSGDDGGEEEVAPQSSEEEAEPSADEGGEDSAVNNSAWDEYEEFQVLPKPEATLFIAPITDGYRATLLSVEREYLLEYVEQVKEAGFTENQVTEDDGDFYSYTADNGGGYKVVVIISNGGGGVDILKI